MEEVPRRTGYGVGVGPGVQFCLILSLIGIFLVRAWVVGGWFGGFYGHFEGAGEECNKDFESLRSIMLCWQAGYSEVKLKG